MTAPPPKNMIPNKKLLCRLAFLATGLIAQLTPALADYFGYVLPTTEPITAFYTELTILSAPANSGFTPIQVKGMCLFLSLDEKDGNLFTQIDGDNPHNFSFDYKWKPKATTKAPLRFLLTAELKNGKDSVYRFFFYNPLNSMWVPLQGKTPACYVTNTEQSIGELVSGVQSTHIGCPPGTYPEALIGNQWVRTKSGEWIELTTVTHIQDGRVEGNQFHVGGKPEGTDGLNNREPMTRELTGKLPEALTKRIPGA